MCFMSERYIKIYIVAIGLNDHNGIFDPPLNDEEIKQFEKHRQWAEEARKKADGPILFDIPFDP